MEIITALKTFYNKYEKMKDNVQQAPLIMKRLEALWKLVFFLDQRKEVQLSDDVKKALENFLETLQKAEILNIKFTEATKMNQMWKSNDFKLEFENLNKSLTDDYISLSGSVHIDQEMKLDEQEKKLSKLEAKLAEQEETLEEILSGALHIDQEMKLDEQEKKLSKLEAKLAEQEETLEEILKRVESNSAHESNTFYCVLQ